MNDIWKIRFIRLAREVSTWSKDSTQIGAVAVDPITRRVLSLGYNGFPSGIEDSQYRYSNQEIKYSFVVHGELNCILNAVKNGVSLNGAYLFVWGLPVCSECAKAVIQVGITHVYWSSFLKTISEKWENSMHFTQCMFDESNIQFNFLELPLNAQ